MVIRSDINSWVLMKVKKIPTLQASSLPRVSPAQSMFDVTVRSDSTSGVHRSLGHKRTCPLLTRSENSGETIK